MPATMRTGNHTALHTHRSSINTNRVIVAIEHNFISFDHTSKGACSRILVARAKLVRLADSNSEHLRFESSTKTVVHHFSIHSGSLSQFFDRATKY